MLGDGEGVQVLLGGGADPNLETSRGTALCRAAHEGDISMLTLLLDGGADVQQITRSGERAHAQQPVA